ncbi:MAG: PIG-L family deacetylase [Bryobacterales bacterium]|nr:PIG-L family deacetylase [Bryobacterales bacterium]
MSSLSLVRHPRRTAILVWILLILSVAPSAIGQENLAGADKIYSSLEELQVTGSALMIAAHPDDENTAVIAYFSRGRHVRMGYLSLNRGEGGQNLLGPEQGVLVGVIRTQELLRAREIDGGVQFFTRVIDFGFSKTAEETFAKWGRENALRDVVWVIREFQPDIIINRFSGTPNDGHGNHQASAILGKEAFHAAADPKRFPDQLKWVKPWQAKRLFWNTYSWRRVEDQIKESEPRLVLPTGEFNPVLGYSYQEIAGMSRSQHRSQTMGAPQRKGEARDFLVLLEGEPATKDPFEGIDLSWGRVPGAGRVGDLLREARDGFDFVHPSKSVPTLLAARAAMLALERTPLVERKLKEVDNTIALCAGLWLDASATVHEIVPGETLTVNLELVNRSSVPMLLESVAVEGVKGEPAVLTEALPLPANHREVKPLRIPLPADFPITQPYWLKEPPRNDRYQVEPDDYSLIGQPETPSPLRARIRVKVGDGASAQEIEYRRPVQQRYVDPLYGELTRPLVVTPAVTLHLAQGSLVFPANAAKKVGLTLTAHRAKLSGQAALRLPDGWSVKPASIPFQIANAHEMATVSFEVTPPAGEQEASLQAVAKVDGALYQRGMTVVSYPHIPPQTMFFPETARIVRSPIELLSHEIGYVMGAGDDIPQALEQIGAHVTLLTEADLTRGDLSRFEAIVAGVRAYNTRPDLVASHQRLLHYIEQGGTYLVQYNTTQNLGAGAASPGAGLQIGPYPMEIGRDRVSVEDAPVTILKPGHPLLNLPNRIRERDFAGWVQERGLYFPSKFDDRYETVIATHDPGEKPLADGILYAKFGKGVFIYTSYSWFRQLPAGVPGAFRIFANMLSAGKTAAVKP